MITFDFIVPKLRMIASQRRRGDTRVCFARVHSLSPSLSSSAEHILPPNRIRWANIFPFSRVNVRSKRRHSSDIVVPFSASEVDKLVKIVFSHRCTANTFSLSFCFSFYRASNFGESVCVSFDSRSQRTLGTFVDRNLTEFRVFTILSIRRLFSPFFSSPRSVLRSFLRWADGRENNIDTKQLFVRHYFYPPLFTSFI